MQKIQGRMRSLRHRTGAVLVATVVACGIQLLASSPAMAGGGFSCSPLTAPSVSNPQMGYCVSTDGNGNEQAGIKWFGANSAQFGHVQLTWNGQSIANSSDQWLTTNGVIQTPLVAWWAHGSYCAWWWQKTGPNSYYAWANWCANF